MTKQGASTAVPRLRFPEFRNRSEWMEKSLKDVCMVNPTNEGLPDSFIYIDLESVERGTLKSKNRIQRLEAPSRAQRLLRNGDVIFQVVRPYQRNNLFVDFHDDATYVASTGYAQLRAHDSETFLYQIVHTDPFVEEVIAKCTGSNYPAINSSDLADVLLFAPKDAAEQQKIADCLTSLDEVIAAQRQKVEALKAHKRGLMQQLFPREGKTRPRLRFPEFSDAPEWEKKPIRELGEITIGKTPSTRDASLWGGNVLFITPTDIFEDDKYQQSSQRNVVATTALKILPAGSIVYTCIASIGKMAITVRPSVTNQQINSIVTHHRVDNEFVYYSLAHMTPRIRLMPASSTLPIINKAAFSEINIWIPSDGREQKMVAECLSTVDVRITVESEKLDVLRTHKNSLMQQLFPMRKEG